MEAIGSSLAEDQERVLAALSETYTFAPAAERAGVNPRRVWRWLRDDPAFAARAHDAQQVALSALEHRLIDRGTNGAERTTYEPDQDTGELKLTKLVREPDTPALLATLRARVPAYRQQTTPPVQLVVRSYGGTIDLHAVLPGQPAVEGQHVADALEGLQNTIDEEAPQQIAAPPPSPVIDVQPIDVTPPVPDEQPVTNAPDPAEVPQQVQYNGRVFRVLDG